MDVRSALSLNLKACRKARGLSQEALGQLCGLNRAYVGFIEQQRVNPSIETLEKIALGLGVDLILLLIDPAEGRLLPEAIKRNCNLDNTAICTLRDGFVDITPLDHADTDLSSQVLKSLVLNGWDGDDLIQKYEEVYPQIKALLEK